MDGVTRRVDAQPVGVWSLSSERARQACRPRRPRYVRDIIDPFALGAKRLTRMACQAPTSLTRRCVFELKAKGEEKGEDTCDKRFAIAKQLIIGRFVLKVDGDGPVFTGLAGGVAHGSSSGQRVGVVDDPTWGNACPMARGWGWRRGVLLNWVACAIFGWPRTAALPPSEDVDGQGLWYLAGAT